MSVFYLRAGYTPDDYPTATQWHAREMMEKCSAVSCPSVAYQLVGAKKIQQDIAVAGVTPTTPDAFLLPCVLLHGYLVDVAQFSISLCCTPTSCGRLIACTLKRVVMVWPDVRTHQTNLWRLENKAADCSNSASLSTRVSSLVRALGQCVVLW